MNIAYVVSAYKLPQLLVRLVRRLDGRGTSFFIHVDARTPHAVYEAMVHPLAGHANVRFLPRHACYWGDFGHVRASLLGLEAALESEPVDYAILLTGQDYPLTTNAEIAATFERADGRAFMRYFPLPSEHWSEGGLDRIEHRQIRIGHRIFRFPGQPFGAGPAGRAWAAATRRLRLTRRFPAALRPYGGSSYWCLPADVARYVLRFLADNPAVEQFLRHTAVPDEMVFQTVVMNSPLRSRVVNDDLRYIDWAADAPHPAVLTSGDFGALIASGKLFGRKFDPAVDPDILDRLDDHLDSDARPASRSGSSPTPT